MQQKLSIITINYNNALGLQKTIESVVNQSFTDFEFVVVDGGSSDESVEVIKKYESKITKWISEKDNGIYNALNKGIQLATGEYLLFLNSGDILYNNEVLKNNFNHLDGTAIISFDIQVKGQGIDQINQHPDEIQFSFLFDETLAHQSTVIQKKLFDQIGLYDESLKIVSDWKFFIEAITYHQASYKAVHDVLAVYFLDGISSSSEGSFLRKKERDEVLKNEFKLFYSDYMKSKEMNQIFELNRYKMLTKLENTNAGRKTASLILSILTKFMGK